MELCEMEEWRPVVGHPGYHVSNFGRVKSDKIGGEIMRPFLTRGYPAVKLSTNNKRTNAYVHNLVLEAFVGPRPTDGDWHGCHDDGNPFNSMVCNLRWDSRSGNFADREKHGTTRRGEKAGTAKLSNEQVEQIRAEIAAGGPIGFQSRIAEKWGVSTGYISNLKHNKIRRYG